jgi:hypothetical protein
MQSSKIILGSPVTTTSGTAIDFTNIPSFAKRITVNFDAVSTTGTSLVQLQIGTSSGIEISGYSGNHGDIAAGAGSGSASISTGFGCTTTTAAANGLTGTLILSRMSVNKWVCFGVLSQIGVTNVGMTSGIKTLAGTLDRLRLTTVLGTPTFDAGSINITWE